MGKGNLMRFEWAIKRLLCNKVDYTVLEGLLPVLLNEEIKIINIRESESNQTHEDNKFNRVDILVENSMGELLIVEGEAIGLEKAVINSHRSVKNNLIYLISYHEA